MQFINTLDGETEFERAATFAKQATTAKRGFFLKKGIAEEEMGRFIQQIEKKEKDEEVGNVSVKDNLDRKINVSEDDINLIDKIMPNKTEEEKKENEGRGT